MSKREIPVFELQTAAVDVGAKESNIGHMETTMNQLAQDPNIVDWNSPDDPANPLNWPSFKMNFHVVIVSIFTLYGSVVLFLYAEC